MPLLLLFILALITALVVSVLAWKYPRAADPAPAAARKVGAAVAETSDGCELRSTADSTPRWRPGSR